MIYCGSQTTFPKLVNDSLVVITPDQLKATNLIFLEHKKLKLVNTELNSQINYYKILHENDLKADSLKSATISKLRSSILEYDDKIQTQNLVIDKQKKRIKYLSIGGITAVLLTFLLCK